MKFFDRLQIATTQRSKETLNSFHTTTTDFGRLDVPYWKEVVDGEDFTFNMRTFFDAAPMVVPTRGRIFCNVRCFFVPNRIMCNKELFDWNLWINFQSSNSHPYVTDADVISRYQDGSNHQLQDPAERRDFRRVVSQLRLPSRVYNSTNNGIVYDNPEKLTPFPFYAYNRIWWDWYRDSNLIDDSQINNYVRTLGSGEQDISSWFRPRYCCYGKDYFTTAKLNPQDGSLASAAGNVSDAEFIARETQNVYKGDGEPWATFNGSGTPINWLRAANALQKILERNNIAGGRVMARFLARFGAAPDSIRLDQSEYLGGNSFIMSIGGITSPLQAGDGGNVVNPWIDDSVSMAGQRVGRGVIDGSIPTIKYHVKEHGIFMVICTVVPEIGYYQGLHKSWQRGVDNDPTNYLTPECQTEGFEPIFNKEVALCDLEEDSTNAALWGFTRKYASYCYMNNNVSGDFVLKETRTGMEAFHLLRDFRDNGGTVYAPALAPAFTMITPAARQQYDRIFQIIGNNAEYDHFEGYHDCVCTAILPKSPNAMPSLEEDSHSSGKHINIDNGGTRF